MSKINYTVEVTGSNPVSATIYIIQVFLLTNNYHLVIVPNMKMNNRKRARCETR
jgi:hypothetical protein